jgi:hypothetical protein
MKHIVGLTAMLLAALTLLGALSAGDDGKKGKEIDVIFGKLDANRDGRLSKDEFLKVAEKFRDKEKARKHLGLTYDKLDPDQKGLSREQFRAFADAAAKKKAEK